MGTRGRRGRLEEPAVELVIEELLGCGEGEPGLDMLAVEYTDDEDERGVLDATTSTGVIDCMVLSPGEASRTGLQDGTELIEVNGLVLHKIIHHVGACGYTGLLGNQDELRLIYQVQDGAKIIRSQNEVELR
ncbi:hypothetical protein PG988_014571 [Apiospora saccharicola]